MKRSIGQYPSEIPARFIHMAEYQLEREWNVWLSSRIKKNPADRAKSRAENPSSDSGGASKSGGAPKSADSGEDSFTPPKLTSVFSTVATYWKHMNSIPTPSKLIVDFNVFVFRRGTPPVWEHPDNKSGGRWTFAIKNDDPKACDHLWLQAHLALVGETLDPDFEVIGIALARRRAYTRVSVWTKNRENKEMNLEIGKRFKAITGAHKLEYQDHGEGYKSYRYVL